LIGADQDIWTRNSEGLERIAKTQLRTIGRSIFRRNGLFNSYSLPLMKQRLNADFINASADGFIFIFSQIGIKWWVKF
jgi:hypothetical protein